MKEGSSHALSPENKVKTRTHKLQHFKGFLPCSWEHIQSTSLCMVTKMSHSGIFILCKITQFLTALMCMLRVQQLWMACVAYHQVHGFFTELFWVYSWIIVIFLDIFPLPWELRFFDSWEQQHARWCLMYLWNIGDIHCLIYWVNKKTNVKSLRQCASAFLWYHSFLSKTLSIWFLSHSLLLYTIEWLEENREKKSILIIMDILHCILQINV